MIEHDSHIAGYGDTGPDNKLTGYMPTACRYRCEKYDVSH
jgi:hypothetical protein